MTTAEFNKLVLERCTKIEEILASKAKEYARGDRLSNFKAAAGWQECTPETALQGMRVKHEVSIRDMVKDIERSNGALIWTLDKWEEKIGDSINYLILLEGLIRERFQDAKKGGKSNG